MSPDLSWSPNPFVLLLCALAAGAYFRRWRSVRRQEPQRSAAQAPLWRLCCFMAAVLLVVAALVSPLDALSDQLFLMHMVQHLLLLDAVPILAIAGLTKVILRPLTHALHDFERRAGALAHPACAVMLYVALIWSWHVPAAYDLALRSAPVHVLEHITFVLAGSLYWWHLLSPIRARLRLGGMGPVVYTAASKIAVGALGMGLAFAPSALFPYYAHHAPVWGIAAREDQAMAGLTMAVEQSLVMGTALVALFVRALVESEREQQRRERYGLA